MASKAEHEDFTDVGNTQLVEMSRHRHSWTKIVERDPAMPRSWLRTRGSAIVQWLDNPGEPHCPIPPRSLTFQQVQRFADIEDCQGEIMMELILPNNSPPMTVGTYIMADFEWVIFEGMTASGLLCLNDIEREKPADSAVEENPHISDIALALYTRDYAIESLRHVFVKNVVNNQTLAFFKAAARKFWPQNMQPVTWEYGSQQFEEMLGTRIGRTVGYIVLGAFARGSHRIARIMTWSNRDTRDVHFRFDIEPIAFKA